MKRFENFRSVLRAKSLVLGVVLFSLLVMAGHLTLRAQTPTGWRLREICVDTNMMDGNLGGVTSERYDENGGTVEINARGDQLCQGGIAKLRFIWKFTNSVERVAPGNTIGIALEAGQVSGNKPCAVEFANRSYMFSRGGEGARYSHFSPAEINLIDERFADTNFRARATADPNGERTASDGVKVKAHPINPKTPWAIFEIVIETTTAAGGGFLYYTYVYELDGSESDDNSGSQTSSPTSKRTVVSVGDLTSQATYRVEPVYPEAARAARVSGTVTIAIVVDEEGNVVSASAISGHPLLRQSAESAVRQWRFTPTQVSGQPVRTSGTVRVSFTPDSGSAFNVSDNSSFQGDILTYYPGTTAAQCQTDCAARGNCQGFTFVRAGFFQSNDPPMCYLITRITSENSSSCCVSGRRR
jgi:TonB family protein